MLSRIWVDKKRVGIKVEIIFHGDLGDLCVRFEFVVSQITAQDGADDEIDLSFPPRP
jgi:hypothetical protein